MSDSLSIVDWLFLFDKIDAQTWLLFGYVIPSIIFVAALIFYWWKS